MQTINSLRAAVAAALVAIGGQAAAADPKPPQTKPEVTLRHGNDFGIAPAVVMPLRKGGQVEIKGPSLHPQVQPSFNGGSVTVTVPWPEGKKK
jgi:hypothetical protein